jgi:hypothetical protein
MLTNEDEERLRELERIMDEEGLTNEQYNEREDLYVKRLDHLRETEDES